MYKIDEIDQQIVDLLMEADEFRPSGFHQPGDPAARQVLFKRVNQTQPAGDVAQRPRQNDKDGRGEFYIMVRRFGHFLFSSSMCSSDSMIADFGLQIADFIGFRLLGIIFQQFFILKGYFQASCSIF